MITIQYLEPGPHIGGITTTEARLKLESALDCLPIDCLLIGWDIPSQLEYICRNLANEAGIKFYRWQPVLTGDGFLFPEVEWRTKNIETVPIPGFQGLPEFTFMCPNNPEARSASLSRIADLAQSKRYDGFFLDRMRFPSPSKDPVNLLSCFCEYCKEAALDIGLDLEEVSKFISNTDENVILESIIRESFDPLSLFLDFRQHTITHLIKEITEILRFYNLEVGFDCFSPSLTRMVGQDLSLLAPLANWTKIMVYGHAFGPASLPYELSSITKWLIDHRGLDAMDALVTLSEITNLQLNESNFSHQNLDLVPDSLATECERGRQLVGSNKLLAGIELVEILGVSELNDSQIETDLRAIKAVRVDGISLSWDLWHIPINRLELFYSVWSS